MKHFILSLVVVCCTVITVNAQVAVKGGVNFTNMLFEGDENNIEDLARNGAVKFTAGLAFILPLNDVFAVQPELLYSQKGAESTYKLLGEEYTNDLTYNYLDIPLLLRVSLGDSYGEGIGLYLNGGGYIGYAFNGKTKIESPLGDTESDITFDEVDDQGRLDYGAAVGAGVSLGNVFIDVRYNHGVNNILDDDANNNNDSFNKLQHRSVALTAGLVF